MQVDEEAEEKGDFSAAAADFPVVPEMGAMGLIGWDGGDFGGDDDGLGGDLDDGLYGEDWPVNPETVPIGTEGLKLVWCHLSCPSQHLSKK